MRSQATAWERGEQGIGNRTQISPPALLLGDEINYAIAVGTLPSYLT